MSSQRSGGDQSHGSSETVCNACGFESSFVPEGMIKCERCQAVWYCSVHCLQWDWKSGGHAKVCEDIRVQDDSTDHSSLEPLDPRVLDDATATSMDINGVFADSSMSSNPSTGSQPKKKPPIALPTLTEGPNERSTASLLSGTYLTNNNASTPSLNRKKDGKGPKLGAFFEQQKPSAAAPAKVEAVVEEVVEEEVVDSDQSASLDLLQESQESLLKSIVEEESVSEEPDLEGSWRSREPFEVVNPTRPPPPTVIEHEEDSLDEEEVQEEEEEVKQDHGEEVMDEELTEEEEVVDESMEESLDESYEEELRDHDEDYQESQSDEADYTTDNYTADNYTSDRDHTGNNTDEETRAGEAYESRTFSYGPDSGYSSNDDGSYSSDGSMQGEAASQTNRTEDTDMLAAQPSSDGSFKANDRSGENKRLLHESLSSSGTGDDSNELLLGALPPQKIMKESLQSDASSSGLYPSSTDFGSRTSTAASQPLLSSRLEEKEDAVPPPMDRNQSGETAQSQAQSLKDFRQIYERRTSGDAPPSTDHRGLKDFRQAYSSSPPQSPPQKPKENLLLTKSINKALRDYEKLYGPEAASAAIAQLMAGLSTKEELNAEIQAVETPADVLKSENHEISAVSAEPVVVATAVLASDEGQVSEDDEPSPIAASGVALSSATLETSATSLEAGGTPAEASPTTRSSSASTSPPPPPRYLAYRSHLTKSATPTKKKPSEAEQSETAVSNAHATPRSPMTPPRHVAPRVAAAMAAFESPKPPLEGASTAEESQLPLSTAQAVSRTLPVAEKELATGEGEAVSAVSDEEAALVAESAVATSAKKNGATPPRYLAYRSHLENMSPLARESMRKALEEKERCATGGTINETESAETASGAAVVMLAAGATTAAAPERTPPRASKSTPRASPGYLQYRSALAKKSPQKIDAPSNSPAGPPSSERSMVERQSPRAISAPVAVAEAGAGAADEIGRAQGSSTPSTVSRGSGVVPGSSPRYLDYRATVAQRLQTTPERVESAPPGRAVPALEQSDDEGSVDEAETAEMEQRLTSYLRKSTGAAANHVDPVSEGEAQQFTEEAQDSSRRRNGAAAAAAVGTAAAVGMAINSAERAPGESYTVEPLRSRRAVATMATSAPRVETVVLQDQVPADAPRSRRAQAALTGSQSVAQTKTATDAPPGTVAPRQSFVSFSPSTEDKDIESGVSAARLPSRKRHATSERMWKAWFICIWIVLLPLAIGLGVGLSSRKRSSSAASDVSNSTASPEPAPTLNPVTTSPTPLLRPGISPSSNPVTTAAPVQLDMPTAVPVIEAPSMAPAGSTGLLNLLSAASFDGGASLSAAGTPQNLAYSWLANSTGVDALTEQQQIQRFALATLFYSTDGKGWTGNQGWLTDEDECDWFSRANNPCNAAGAMVDLSLGFNELVGVLPPEVGMLTSLTSISLSGGTQRSIGGSIPSEFGALTALRFFSVRDNVIQGGIPPSIGNWTQLLVFDASNNRLGGGFPSALGELTLLNELDLSGNMLNGEIPDISALVELTRLSLMDNRFTGPLDGSIGLFPQLRSLNLQLNAFTSLPNAVGLLTSLEVLEAFDNSIEGPLFTVMGGLTNLRVFDVHNNSITGIVPAQLGTLTNLRYMDLSENAFTSSIPSELGALTNLIDLILRANQLEGSFPSGLSTLTRLGLIRVDDNQLTGVVPEVVCDAFTASLPTFYLDCGGANPEISCPPGPCCTYCCEETGDVSACTCLYEGTGFEFLC